MADKQAPGSADSKPPSGPFHHAAMTVFLFVVALFGCVSCVAKRMLSTLSIGSKRSVLIRI